jgi:Uma2 family endonuclease
MAAPAQRIYRADYLWESPDDGNRYEIIDGRLVVNPPPFEIHQRLIANLMFCLETHVRSNVLGRVYPAPFGVVLDAFTGVQPDLVFVSNARRGVITERGVEGTPDLVVEVFSRRTRRLDVTEKLARYEEARVPHYWTLDPDAIRLDARELRDGRNVVVASHGAGEIFEPSLFPGLRLPIDDLWA